LVLLGEAADVDGAREDDGRRDGRRDRARPGRAFGELDVDGRLGRLADVDLGLVVLLAVLLDDDLALAGRHLGPARRRARALAVDEELPALRLAAHDAHEAAVALLEGPVVL